MHCIVVSHTFVGVGDRNMASFDEKSLVTCRKGVACTSLFVAGPASQSPSAVKQSYADNQKYNAQCRVCMIGSHAAVCACPEAACSCSLNMMKKRGQVGPSAKLHIAAAVWNADIIE